MAGPGSFVIYGAEIALAAIIAARFVMHELASAVHQYKELVSSLRDVKELPAKKDDDAQ